MENRVEILEEKYLENKSLDEIDIALMEIIEEEKGKKNKSLKKKKGKNDQLNRMKEIYGIDSNLQNILIENKKKNR